MNATAILALLEEKGIISRAEGEKIAEFINNRPQPTVLDDAVNQVHDILTSVEDAAAPVSKQVEAKAAEITADMEAKVKEASKKTVKK